MRESKECQECGGIYFRSESVSDGAWEARKYCSVACGGKAQSRRNKEKKEEPAAQVPVLSDQTDEAPKGVLTLEPVMRELKIVRVGPNPRLLVCEYFELAERRVCTVFVKRTKKFVRGMKLTMPEPRDEADYRRPWIYTGPAPKHRGRW